MYSAPFEFNKQDEGHAAHNPLTWQVISTYYKGRGTYPLKKYGNRQVLTGPFAGTQTNNKELIVNHYTKNGDWRSMRKINQQKSWSK